MRKTLNDIGLIRWGEPEHIDAINDALDAILVAAPDLYEDYRDLTLVAGNEQSLPADGYLLFDVLWNVSAAGVQGRRITKVAKSALDRSRAAWSESGENSTVRHWAQDRKQKSKYYVAPRQPESESNKVHARIARRPVDVASQADELDTPDEMESAVYYYAMQRLCEKDEKFAGSKQSIAFMQKFAMAVRVRGDGEDAAEAVEQQNEGS
jgi:hypothetical protein